MDTCPLTADDFLTGLGILGILFICLSVTMQIVQGIITYNIFRSIIKLNKL